MDYQKISFSSAPQFVWQLWQDLCPANLTWFQADTSEQVGGMTTANVMQIASILLWLHGAWWDFTVVIAFKVQI